MSQELDSRAYIVRIWRSQPDGRWCFSVQDVASGARQGFANLESFLAYFYTTVRDPPDSEDEASGDTA